MPSQLIPGTWVTVPGGGLMCSLIRWATRAPVAHACLYVGKQDDDTDLVEAQPAGVRRARLDAYATYYPGPAPETRMGLAIANTALSLASRHTRYNYLSDFYLGLRATTRMHLPALLFRLASTSHHLQCSQLVDYCYLVNGAHLFTDGRAPGAVSPADLYHLGGQVPTRPARWRSWLAAWRDRPGMSTR